MDDVYVYLMELPGKVKEMVTPCEDGYTVYVDPRQTHAGMVRSYEHAISHINGDDFAKSEVQTIETIRHTEGR